MLASLCYLAPICFYIFSFYTGHVNILIPGVSDQIFNARFGAGAALPASLFIATITCLGTRFPARSVQLVLHAFFACLILFQYFVIAQNGIISLQEGQYGLSCERTFAVNIYLAQHYNGHMILEDTYLGSPNEAQEVGINVHNIISSSSNVMWKKVLQNPAAFVDWVIISERNPRSPYPVQVHTNTQSFRSNFNRVVSKDGLSLYQKSSLKSLPTRPVPENLRNEHPFCTTGDYPRKGAW
jgi:hypothetical protein